MEFDGCTPLSLHRIETVTNAIVGGISADERKANEMLPSGRTAVVPLKCSDTLVGVACLTSGLHPYNNVLGRDYSAGEKQGEVLGGRVLQRASYTTSSRRPSLL